MACELLQREFTISEDKEVLVGCRQLAASKALDLHVELISTVGDAMFPFVENKFNFADILYLMRQGKNTNLTDLIKRVVCMATLDGVEIKPATFDVKFGNDLMLICKIFGFVLEANFLDFFKEGLEINAQRQLEAEEASKQEELKNSSPEKI